MAKKNIEKIDDLLLRLKRETNSITINPLLDGIDLKKMAEFIVKAENDDNYRSKLQNMQACLHDATYIHTTKYNSAFDAYNELMVYEHLSQKLSTEILKEIKAIKTPDYKLSDDEGYCYADLKTIHFLNGNNNYIEIQEDAANSNIKLEKQVKKKYKSVNFGDPVVISPFKKGNSRDSDTITFIIGHSGAIDHYVPE